MHKKTKVIKSKALGTFEETSSGYLPMRLPYLEQTHEAHQIITNKEPLLL